MISTNLQRLKYIAGDFISSNIAWITFNIIRYYFASIIFETQNYASVISFVTSGNVLRGQIFFSIMMMIVYHFSGYYNNTFFKSRAQELFTTISSALINTVLIFFIALINDILPFRTQNYELLLILFAVLFTCTYCVRFIITTDATRKIKSGKWRFNTLIIGSSKSAVQFVTQLSSIPKAMGYNIIGYVGIDGEPEYESYNLPLFNMENISEICAEHNISQLIIVPSKRNKNNILSIVNSLFSLNISIKITPDLVDIITSHIKISNIYGEPLVDIASSSLSGSEQNMKRAGDIFISLIAIIILLPVYIVLAIMVKFSSEGPIIYKQERIGRHHVPFMMYKFRTMYTDAEANGPSLSENNDARITPIGRKLRKYRLDELPQFWNVLKGEMSIVGPRPEREHYIKEILKKAPYYTLVHQIRPGITSWGMVKYGYAKNVNEMIERMKYDIVYIENMTIMVDFKIILYTIRTVLTGKGM